MLLLFLLLLEFCYSRESRPNFLLILVDDLGAADVSYNFHLLNPDRQKAPIPTPAIDKLADEGIKFPRHYSPCICGPSRAALLTGRYPHKIGNPFPVAGGSGDLHPDYKTMANEFDRRGYENHFIGKWGVDSGGMSYSLKQGKWINDTRPKSQGKGPLSRGFHTFFGLFNSAHNHFTKFIGISVDWHDHRPHYQVDYPELDNEPKVHSSMIFTREAIRVLTNYSEARKKSHNTAPFFMHLSYTAPHDPLLAPDEYIAKCKHIPSWRRRIYCAMVHTVDDGVANITKALQDLHLLDDTIIIFLSDNGGFSYVGGRNYPLRGAKGNLMEGGVRVPAFIYGPKFLNGGHRTFHGLAHNVDWTPTLLSLADHGQNKTFHHNLGKIDGIDLSEAIREDRPSPRKNLVVGADPFSNSSAYIRGNYKILLGMRGQDKVYDEPDSSWEIDSKNRQWDTKLEEIIIDGINWISEDLFLYEWLIHILVSKISDFFTGTTLGNFDHHPMDKKIFRNASEAFPFVIPTIEWHSNTKTPKVFLYDLEKDPSESHNLAFEKKELVEEIAHEFFKQLEGSPPQVGTIHYTFRMLAVSMIAASVAIIVLLPCLCYCCFRRKKGHSKSKRE